MIVQYRKLNLVVLVQPVVSNINNNDDVDPFAVVDAVVAVANVANSIDNVHNTI